MFTLQSFRSYRRHNLNGFLFSCLHSDRVQHSPKTRRRHFGPQPVVVSLKQLYSMMILRPCCRELCFMACKQVDGLPFKKALLLFYCFIKHDLSLDGWVWSWNIGSYFVFTSNRLKAALDNVSARAEALLMTTHTIFSFHTVLSFLQISHLRICLNIFTVRLAKRNILILEFLLFISYFILAEDISVLHHANTETKNIPKLYIKLH